MENKMSLNKLLSLTRKAVSKRTLSLSLSAMLAASLLPSSMVRANAVTTTSLPATGQTYEAYPALKDVYKDYFSFGIFGRGEIEGLLYNYASYTPGNEMKPESTQNVKGTFTLTAADNAMKVYSDRNPDMLFYGHTLAWHSQTPTWMWDAPPARYDQPGTFNKDVALKNLNDHIETVFSHYGGRIKAMDVVNEAVGTANPNDWKASLAKGEGWFMALGWEWVELAFLKAAEVVDRNGWDCKLIYNDFGLDSPAKARVVYEMVKDINERYAGRRPNGKQLIEVIGMQAHYNLSTNVTDVENNIKLFATLPGVKVNITEMDVACPPTGTLTPENENNQGMKYAELFKIYRKYAAGPANTTGNPKVIDTVKLAGVRDVTSGWKGGEFAMPYDYNGKAKKALIGILYPDEFLAAHNYIVPEQNQEKKPVDGVHVYDAAKGDTWSGANIILGNDASKWPWSTAGQDGKVAFTPEKDATYRISFNYTATGTSKIRVRWIKDNTNGGYTTADGAAVNNNPYTASQVATKIPAHFNDGMVNMGSYTLTTEIKLDGSQPAEGLIGNIAIRGSGGGNAFSINWIKVEKIATGGATDKLLVNWPEGIEEPNPDGVHVYAAAKGDVWSGANILLGNDASQWPWSTAGEDGKVAFTPEKEATYRLSFNYTSTGANAIRVRWIKDNTNGGYTTADGAAVNSNPYSASQVATKIPAHFNSGMANGETYTLVTEIKLDGSQPKEGLIGNIAIRGGGGSNAFSINWIKVEKIGTNGASDELLVNWKDKSIDPNINLVDLAAAAIKGGTYTIPRTELASQDTKNAWIQTAVNALIPAGNGSTATVAYNNGYVVSVSKGAAIKSITITVNEEETAAPESKYNIKFTPQQKTTGISWFTGRTSSQVEWVEAAGIGADDNYVLKGTHIDGKDFVAANNAVRFLFPEALPAGYVYNVKVSFYVPSALNQGKGTITGPGVVINDGYAHNTHKLPGSPGTIAMDQWKTVDVNTAVLTDDFTMIDFRFVTNNEANHPNVWYIDNIVISQVGELQPVPIWDLTIPSLAKTYEGNFLFGNIIEPSQLNTKTTDMFKSYYNVITAENSMKPSVISNAKGVYNFSGGDAIIEWAKQNNIKVHGHTLVWHSQSPDWLYKNADGTPLTREEARQNMKDYIEKVAGHFAGKVISWDVVNEALDGGSLPITDWRTAARKGSPWYLAYANGADTTKGESGTDYIYDAFVYARLADPNAILEYNDYNETDAWKREAMAQMAEDLNAKWLNDSRNTDKSRKLIEAIGMQSHHYTKHPTPDQVEASIKRFLQAGVKISVSELDAGYGQYNGPENKTLSKEQQVEQAIFYARIFEIFKAYSAHIQRVTIWGMADTLSWRSNYSPVLFDGMYAPKEAYYAVQDPRGYLVKQGLTPRPIPAEPTPTEPSTPSTPNAPGTVTIVNTDIAAVVGAIASVSSNGKVVVDVTANKSVAKEIFNAVKGTDKTVTFIQDGIEWSFNGKDITNTTKAIDMTVRIAPIASSTTVNKAEIAEKVKNENVMVVSFANNGQLPGKAKVRVKLDANWLAGKNKDDISIYYYNPSEKALEAIAIGLKVDAEGYVQFDITHNSDYIIADKDLTKTAVPTPVEPKPAALVRLGGANRYETSVRVSQAGWTTSDNVVLARGDEFADALTAAPFAKQLNSPILLTATKSMDSSVIAELKRLKTKKVYIIGGTGAVSTAVENAVKAMGIAVERIGGSDRYATSLAVANRMTNKSQVFLATGTNYADALSISSYAATTGSPILLTAKNQTTAGVAKFIKDNNSKVYVIGGTGVISEAAVEDIAGAERIAGADRYATNLAVLNKFASGFDFSNIYLATGANYPDAICGSALAGKESAPIVLVNSGNTANQKSYVKSIIEKVSKVKVLGGEGALTPAVMQAILN